MIKKDTFVIISFMTNQAQYMKYIKEKETDWITMQWYMKTLGTIRADAFPSLLLKLRIFF